MATPRKKSPKRSGSHSRRSANSSARPGAPDPPAVVFVDRSLGKDICAGLRDAGFPDVRHMADVYENDGQDVDDDTWITHCGAAAWVAFSKDANITRVHTQAIQASRTIIFLLPDQSMSGKEQLARYVHHRHRIARLVRKGGPAVYKLYPKTVDRVFP